MRCTIKNFVEAGRSTERVCLNTVASMPMFFSTFFKVKRAQIRVYRVAVEESKTVVLLISPQC